MDSNGADGWFRELDRYPRRHGKDPKDHFPVPSRNHAIVLRRRFARLLYNLELYLRQRWIVGSSPREPRCTANLQTSMRLPGRPGQVRSLVLKRQEGRTCTTP